MLAYATWRPLNKRHIGQLRHYAGQLNARLLLLPLVAGQADVVTRPEALVRAVLAARQHLPAGTLVIPVPLAAAADRRPAADLRAQAIVAAAYGATHLLADAGRGAGRGRFAGRGQERHRWPCPACRYRSSARASGPTTRGRRYGARSR